MHKNILTKAVSGLDLCERGSKICTYIGCFVLKTHSNDITPVHQDLQAATVNPDPSLKEFEGATLRYASLKLR